MKLDDLLSGQNLHIAEGTVSQKGCLFKLMLTAAKSGLDSFLNTFNHCYFCWQWTCYLLLLAVLSYSARSWKFSYTFVIGFRYFVWVSSNRNRVTTFESIEDSCHC